MPRGNAGGKIRVVPDSNVLISGLNFRGRERTVLALGERGEIAVYLSPFILAEVRRTLPRKFNYSPAAAQAEIDALRQWVNLVEPTVAVEGVARDDDDNPILACCLEVAADYLITGDRDLLVLNEFQGTIIVNGATFLRIYEERAGAAG